MTDMWFVLNLNPEPWAIGPVAPGRKEGKLYAYVGQNQQLAAYQQAVRDEIIEQLPEGFKPLDCYVELTFYFWRALPSYDRGQGAHRRHQADGTNLMKACEDALQGPVITNDKNVGVGKWYIMDQSSDAESKIVIRVQDTSSKVDALIKIPADVQERMIGSYTLESVADEAGWSPPTESEF